MRIDKQSIPIYIEEYPAAGVRETTVVGEGRTQHELKKHKWHCQKQQTAWLLTDACRGYEPLAPSCATEVEAEGKREKREAK